MTPTGSALLAALVLSLGVSACNYSSPTAPPHPRLNPQDPPASQASWQGTWTLSRVGPAGDCLAEHLKGFVPSWAIDVEVEIAGDRIDILLSHNGSAADEGFWPLWYSGTVDSDGVVSASMTAEYRALVRHDPWLELCYWEWTPQEGQLSATLSPGGRSIAGTVVETYRVVDPNEGATFTVESSFGAANL